MSAADEQHLEVMLFQDMRYQSGPLVLVHLLLTAATSGMASVGGWL